jgi:hypothetical protein
VAAQPEDPIMRALTLAALLAAPALAGEPMRDPRLTSISDARQALFRRDRREADRLIAMAIQAP